MPGSRGASPDSWAAGRSARPRAARAVAPRARALPYSAACTIAPAARVPARSAPAAAPRSRSSLRDGRVRLDRLYQQGCAKALLPRSPRRRARGGADQHRRRAHRRRPARLAPRRRPRRRAAATTQAAERVYRSLGGAAARRDPARRSAPAPALDWLPQETILFDAGRLERRLEVDMAADARLTALETLVLGRAAMGETLAHRRASPTSGASAAAAACVHAEALRAEGDLARATAGPATLGGARALATLVHVAPGAGARLDRRPRAARRARRACSPRPPPRGDVLVLRFLAPDLAPLRASARSAFSSAFRAAPAAPRLDALRGRR